MKTTVCKMFLILLFTCACLWNTVQTSPNLLFIAGPLTNSLVNELNKGELAIQSLDSIAKETASAGEQPYVCKETLPQSARDYFIHLHSRGVTHFKVFLSWSRLLPAGTTASPDLNTVECYKALFRQLSSSNLRPLVVLHQAGIPEVLISQHGGWENEILAHLFENYAEFAFSAFGDFADTWITFSDLYGLVEQSDTEDSESLRPSALKNLILAHQKVYRLYHQLFTAKEKMHYKERKTNLSSFFVRPKDSNVDKVTAAEVTSVYLMVRHGHSYRSANCGTTLYCTVFPESDIARKMPCGCTKCAAIVTDVLAPVSVEKCLGDLNSKMIETESDLKVDTRPFFSVDSDASNHGNTKLFSLAI
ncbi:Lactase-phlorizin hydrolase [Acipenser ruthenus]|uniref:Lactase-phlorizin hydrolase n=1 Tax=Acipenser ruthenus TaxID=7906 RepID=A0A444U183_ACIRT|nr:Lactase-phlorizin hydrolase [Acipenser ruthenus]